MIYLDNAATSFPKPESVYRALDAFGRQSLANPGRAGHKMAIAAEQALDDCRHRLNQLLHGKEPSRFVFTLNCTDALNMAFKGILQEGDHVVTTDLEHNSISRPLRAMELAGRISLTRIPCDNLGRVDPTQIRDAILDKTRLVAMTHASNVLGSVQPIEEIGSIVRERERLFLVDAAQTVGVLPIDIESAKIDLLAFPGHKGLLGPTGTGALYVGARATVGACAREERAATLPARRNRRCSPTSSKAVLQTSWESPASARASRIYRNEACGHPRTRDPPDGSAPPCTDGNGLRGVRPQREVRTGGERSHSEARSYRRPR